MVESFSDNDGDGSSIFRGKIREQDFSAEQKLNELKAAVEELTRQDLLRGLECERQASSCVDEMSSQADLHIGGGDDEGYLNCEKPLEDSWNFFESLFNLFEVDVDPKICQMLKEKKGKNWLLSIIKFMRDKLKESIKKIFARDLSFDQRLDKEIKELQEKLGSGELSEEEFVRVFERLQILHDLKFRLQLAVTGCIITMFTEMFGVELAAIVDASAEKEDKKAEKTSLEAIKEVHEEVKIKIDKREKPKVPVFLFDVSPGFVRPVVLSKPELDLLSNSLKELMPKEVIKEEIRKIKETKVKVKVEEEKKAEQPKKEVCPQKASGQPGEKGTEKAQSAGFRISDKKSRKINRDSFPEHNYPIGNWQEQASLGTSSKSNASTDQRSSAGDAQPPERLTNDVKVEKCVEGRSVEKT